MKNRVSGVAGAVLGLLLFVPAVFGDEDDKPHRDDSQFANLLPIVTTPETPDSPAAASFADLGAWHSFALPEAADASSVGGFAGPYLMMGNEPAWLGKRFVQLGLVDADSNESIDFSGTVRTQQSFPGILRQAMVNDRLGVALDLIFVSDRSALVRAVVQNRSRNDIKLAIDWHGDVFDEIAELHQYENQVLATTRNGASRVIVKTVGPLSSTTDIADDSSRYRIALNEPVTLKRGKHASFYLTVSAYADETEQAENETTLRKLTGLPDTLFADNALRWNDYIDSLLENRSTEASHQRIAVKALMTLILNWRGAAGDLHHQGVTPAFVNFPGFWAWDSWKHSVVLAEFAPELAEDQIRTMFDYQNEAGMVADVIYFDSERNNWRDTKPPLATWAVASVYERTDNIAFVEELFPKLLRYHRWWYAERDHNGNGLCEYGSTDGTKLAAAWESGMDNAARFDGAELLQSGPNAWSMDRESVDLNSYLYAEKAQLAEFAELLGKPELAAQLAEEAQSLKARIQGYFFDPEDGYFYDVGLRNGRFIRKAGPEGWTPLWTGIATPEQAERVMQTMRDPEQFATRVPLPTLAANRPEFSPEDGYWRGPVWLDQFYFGIAALRRYGYDGLADDFTERLLSNAEGLAESFTALHEHYDPITGKKLKAPHFSWTGSHLLMLLTTAE